MERIAEAFRRLRSQHQKALIPYITAGDPSLAVSRKIIFKLIEAGADLIELGVPFSDPTADGPVIQAAMQRALSSSTCLRDVFDLVKDIRHVSQVPLVLFGYYNPFFVFGPRETCLRAGEAGADALLIVDLPHEEADEVRHYAEAAGLDLIALLAPTSDKRRIAAIARKAQGFIYYISMTGVTGASGLAPQDAAEQVHRIKACTEVPVVVGFGISTPEQAREMGNTADGVVIGSALVRLIAENRDAPDLPRRAGKFVSRFKRAFSLCEESS